MRAGGSDTNFFSVTMLLVFLGAIAAVGIDKMMQNMKNVTFSAPTAVQTATTVSR